MRKSKPPPFSRPQSQHDENPGQDAQGRRNNAPVPGLGLYVLVVDDSPDGLDMLTEYLQFRGFAVVGAADGAAALEQAFAQPPLLVLMDLRMPGISGLEATRQLKAHPATKDAIVVALTANPLGAHEALARQSGCDAFLAKPFDIVRLGNLVEAVMRRGRDGLSSLGSHTAQPQ